MQYTPVLAFFTNERWWLVITQPARHMLCDTTPCIVHILSTERHAVGTHSTSSLDNVVKSNKC